ncbi:hypothetical protein DBA20_19845 [Pandoraea capi]|nr:hypothetical protein [Pandoraea sp. LA3]MDN4585231.1 hypothetical protein [Pandoraea capi]
MRSRLLTKTKTPDRLPGQASGDKSRRDAFGSPTIDRFRPQALGEYGHGAEPLLKGLAMRTRSHWARAMTVIALVQRLRAPGGLVN